MEKLQFIMAGIFMFMFGGWSHQPLLVQQPLNQSERVLQTQQPIRGRVTLPLQLATIGLGSVLPQFSRATYCTENYLKLKTI